LPKISDQVGIKPLVSSFEPVEAPKIGSTTRGIPARSGPWLAAPYPFGIEGPTRDMGPLSKFMSVRV